MSDFEQRLAKLESQAPRQVTKGEEIFVVFRELLWFGIAYYLGDPSEINSPVEAYAHALGYPRAYEINQALEKENSEVQARALSANQKLMAKFGASWEHKLPSIDEWPAIQDALKRMEAGLSDEYKDRLHGSVEDELRRLRSGY